MNDVLFNTQGGRNLFDAQLNRVPDKGELVYRGKEKYKVKSISTFIDPEDGSSSYVVFVERWSV